MCICDYSWRIFHQRNELLCQILIDNVKFSYTNAVPTYISTKTLKGFSSSCPCQRCTLFILKFAKVMDEMVFFFAIICISRSQMNLDMLSLLYRSFLFLLCKLNPSFLFSQRMEKTERIFSQVKTTQNIWKWSLFLGKVSNKSRKSLNNVGRGWSF